MIKNIMKFLTLTKTYRRMIIVLCGLYLGIWLIMYPEDLNRLNTIAIGVFFILEASLQLQNCIAQKKA